MEEADILENSFQLLFAFDEIVALGYRENVNLAQIRTFIEMDSHEERVINAVKRVCIFVYAEFSYVFQSLLVIISLFLHRKVAKFLPTILFIGY